MELILEIVGEFIISGIIELFDRNLDIEMRDDKAITPFKILLYSLWLGVTALITFTTLYFIGNLMREFNWALVFVILIVMGITIFTMMRSIRYTKSLFFKK